MDAERLGGGGKDVDTTVFEDPYGRKLFSEEWVPPKWLEDKGQYWKRQGSEWKFNPHAYDPRAPHAIHGRTFHLASNPSHALEDPFDLNNLRMIRKEKVERLLGKLEDFAEEIERNPGDERTIVAMLGTGGTLSMSLQTNSLNPAGPKILIPNLNPDQLLEHAGAGLKDKHRVAHVEFPTIIDSSEQEIDYEAELAITMCYIWKNASPTLKKHFAGFLCTHGTDTMSGGGTYTTMMLGSDCPFSFGFVGAQKTTEDEFEDVGANVRGAFETLRKMHKLGIKAPFVYMGGTQGGAFNPCGVVKRSDVEVNAFESPIHRKLLDAGTFAKEGLLPGFPQEYDAFRAATGTENERHFTPVILRGYEPVIRYSAELGDDPRDPYEAILRSRDEIQKRVKIAATVTTFGAFTLKTKVLRAIMAAAQEVGVTVFAANPFPQGSTEHAYGPAQAIRDSGAHPTEILPIALRAKIKLAYTIFGDDLKKIVAFVLSNDYVGEQPPAFHDKPEGDRAIESHAKRFPRNELVPRMGAPKELFELIQE